MSAFYEPCAIHGCQGSKLRAERDATAKLLTQCQEKIIPQLKEYIAKLEADRVEWKHLASELEKQSANERERRMSADAERDALRALLAEARDEGIDDAWITFEEGQRWLRNVAAALREWK
jgi:septal ring factor EnvC (AmiA/AmiB activator)